MLFMDNNGDSLIVSGAFKGFENIVNNGLGGLYTIQCRLLKEFLG